MQRYYCTLLSLLFLLVAPALVLAQSDHVEDRPVIVVTDADIDEEDVVFWTADNVYQLDGAVFVEDGAELHIEAGTVVKANDGQGIDASALIITRGGKIFAEGSPTQPVIFTSVQDNISSADLLDYQSRGLWGGIVILGHARTNNPGDTSGDWKEIEGINEIIPAGDTRAEYGGTDDDDDSGIMRYVSIRHTGINIGESDGNEIQGLTLGAVGNSTTLEYIESYASGDDGIEFFGGTVNLKYFVSAFNSDDAIDWDEGWRGKGQFWFVLQGTDAAGAAAEMDGAGGDEHFEPYAIPTVFNATYIGPGVGNTPASDRAEMLIFRDNSGGYYNNSIFTDFETSEGGFALKIEDVDNSGTKTEDSRKRFEAEDLALHNNIWWSFGAGNELNDVINHQGDAAYTTQITDYLVEFRNHFQDPKLRGIERGLTGTGQLDPRPHLRSPAMNSALTALPAGNDFFTRADFIGAFGMTNWARDWTALDALNYFGNLHGGIVGIEVASNELPSTIALDQNYPNPFNPTTTIEFAILEAQHVRLAVFDLLGRQVALLHNGPQASGTYRVSFDGASLASGMYLYRLDTDTMSITKSMLLIK